MSNFATVEKMPPELAGNGDFSPEKHCGWKKYTCIIALARYIPLYHGPYVLSLTPPPPPPAASCILHRLRTYTPCPLCVLLPSSPISNPCSASCMKSRRSPCRPKWPPTPAASSPVVGIAHRHRLRQRRQRTMGQNQVILRHQ